MALPLLALAGAGVPRASAAAVNPLPAVARALNGVASYQVVVTTSSSGVPPRRPTGTRTPTPPRNGRTGTRRGPGMGIGFGFGPQTRTIVSVRKNGLFEEHITITGKDRAGKTTSSDILVYGKQICTRASGAKAYSCQTSSQFNYSLDPTVAFTQGAGSTTFAHAGTKSVGGQSCTGYAYANQSQYASTKGTVYIAAKTNLPCEQVSTSARHFPGGNGGTAGSGSFSQTTTAIWSRFNDKSLSVPSMPK